MSRHWNAENRKLLREGKIKGFFAGPHESFPVAGPEDITHAFELAHHAEAPDVIMEALKRGAKEHGWESAIPAQHQTVQKAAPSSAAPGGPARTPQAQAYNSTRIQAEAHAHAAHNASRAAVTTPTPENHGLAAQAHNVAAQSHFSARVKAAGSGNQAAVATHNTAMMQHNQQKAYHTAQQGGNTAGVRPAWNHAAVAKAEGEPVEAMTHEEILKAQVHAHIRHLGTGKVVQVKDYTTARQVAHTNTAEAHRLSGATQVDHTAAAAAHRHAEAGHQEAGRLAHSTDQPMHRAMALSHSKMAQMHEAESQRKGVDMGGDGPNRPEHLKDLEDHEDFQGFGYLGHKHRTPATDKALAEAANKGGHDRHDLAAYALGRAGRNSMDTMGEVVKQYHGADAFTKLNAANQKGAMPEEEYNSRVKKLHAEVPHQKLVEFFHKELQEHLTGKSAKHYGAKEYAKELRDRHGKDKYGMMATDKHNDKPSDQPKKQKKK
jgi:hypothetical protein